jgi:murein DD-endopeptidase MepM/ murein hydrolase activator NlpD
MSCPCEGAKDTPEVSQVQFEQTEFVFRAPGETINCYLQRTGGVQPAVPEDPIVIDQIATASIASTCDMKMDKQFEMTKGSLTPPSIYVGTSENKPTRWEIELKNKDDEIVNIADTGLQFDTAQGKLTGTISKNYKGKMLKANVKAFATNTSSNAEAEVDAKAYAFAVDECKGDDVLKLIIPLVHSSGKIVRTSEFGEPRSNGKTHKGLDYAVSGRLIGTIVAAADGEVMMAEARDQYGYGSVIKINHKSSSGKMLGQTLYAHWERALVSVGDKVAAGQPIAIEGNKGHSSGPHLHFELRVGTKSIPENPLPYINGTMTVSTAGFEDPGQVDENQLVQQQNQNVGLTPAQTEAVSACSKSVPIGNDPTYKNEPGGVAPDNQIFHNSKCRPEGPEGKPSKQEVMDKVNSALDRYPELDAEDRKYFLHMTKIETSYDPYATANSAKCPKCSALGPYQMINDTAKHYYAKIGIPNPSCEDRCDIDKATDAMVVMYKEQKKIYDNYKATGKIAGKYPPNNAHTARYPSLTKAGFIYGLLHHDGVGNAQRGVNAQGVDYYNSHRPSS